MEWSSVSTSSSTSYSVICAEIFWIASESISPKSASANGLQTSCGPYAPDTISNFPKTISGCSWKYGLIQTIRCFVSPFSFVKSFRWRTFTSTHAGSSVLLGFSFFCKNRISVLTIVPAFSKKVLFGRRIAPSRSHRSAIYFRTRLSRLSIVPPLIPLDVISARTPPGLVLSIDFAIK